jgi:hypothetical protein
MAAATPPADDDRALRQAMEYSSISSAGYTRYPLFPLNRPVYSRIGTYVGHGQYLMQWDEIRDRHTDEKLAAGQSILQTGSQSMVRKHESIDQTFGSISMVQEGMTGRGSAFFMGRGPITTFSPLILYKTDYAGTRADYSLPGQDFSFVLSRGGLHGRLFSSFLGTSSGTVDNSPVLLYGGHWQGRFGPLQLGSTFLRQVQSDLRGDQETLFRGDVPYRDLRQPHTVIVRFEDDNPGDAFGMAVYGADAYVRSSEGTTYTSARPADGATYKAGLRPTVKGRAVGSHWEAAGKGEAVDFTFSMPPEIAAKDLEFVAVVAGDYKIGIRQRYVFLNPSTRTEMEVSWPTPPPPTAQYANNFRDLPYTPEPFYTVRRAEGAPGLEQQRTVRFHHQVPTGQTFYGASARVRAKGLYLDGEYALNPQEFIFPKKGGDRERRTASAGFLRATRDVAGLGALGLEWYRLEPTYGGWYDSRRGGCVFFTDMVGEASTGEQAGVESATQEFPLYDDNDDHDTFADDFINDFPNFPGGQFGGPQAPQGFIPLGGGAMESGTHPGLDMDRDFIYDTDVNRNAVADWFEPLFAYAVDPPEFTYDIDFNNNGVPDARDNDNEPDYPYRRDQQGLHLSYDLARRPTWLDRATVGWQRSRQIAGSGRSEALYLRTEMHATLGGLDLKLADDMKRVRDDITDDVYPLLLTTDLELFKRFNTARYLPPPDLLLMRDSFVNTAFVETEFAPVSNLEVVNSLKYIVNVRSEQVDGAGALLQPSGTLHNFTMVNKLQYVLRPTAALTLTARCKHLLARWDAGSYNYRTVATSPADTLRANPGQSWSMITPTLKARYRLTPNTSVEMAQAGLFVPALRARYADREAPARSWTSNLSILQLTMTGQHQGYVLTSNVGVRRELTEYHEDSGLPKDSYSAFFVDLVLGVE